MRNRVGVPIVERNPKKGSFQIFADVDGMEAVEVKCAQHVGGFFVAINAGKYKMCPCLMTCLCDATNENFGHELAPEPLVFVAVPSFLDQ